MLRKFDCDVLSIFAWAAANKWEQQQKDLVIDAASSWRAVLSRAHVMRRTRPVMAAHAAAALGSAWTASRPDRSASCSAAELASERVLG